MIVIFIFIHLHLHLYIYIVVWRFLKTRHHDECLSNDGDDGDEQK